MGKVSHGKSIGRSSPTYDKLLSGAAEASREHPRGIEEDVTEYMIVEASGGVPVQKCSLHPSECTQWK